MPCGWRVCRGNKGGQTRHRLRRGLNELKASLAERTSSEEPELQASAEPVRGQGSPCNEQGSPSSGCDSSKFARIAFLSLTEQAVPSASLASRDADAAALGLLVKMSARKRRLIRVIDAIARPMCVPDEIGVLSGEGCDRSP